MNLGLAGKIALVTGANRGIGAAIATELAKESVHLCLVARDSDKSRQVAANLVETHGVEVHSIAADLRDPEAPGKVLAATIEHFGRLDLLINNAGATRRADFFDLTEEDWQDGFALKFHGYVRMTRAAWPHLKAARGGVINIIGTGSRAGSAEFTIGGSVNAALVNFTKAMADVGMRDNVRVNAINPGLIETERFERNVARVMRERAIGRDDAIAHILAAHGTTRVGRPEEIGALATYIASGQAAFMQGSIVDIDGGANRAT